MSHSSIIHWSSLTCTKNEILNLSGHATPLENYLESLLEGLKETSVSNFAVKDKLLVSSGLHGELIIKYLDSNNDSGVIDFDFEKFQLSNLFHFP
ncbi:hypothetical protein R3W88_024342 [Solanum pinnatisectum]|uniref:Uncharacterized protein n=1 Tax=Solanum pinnatisectum TaxID=50273 RepID=A0AAV9M273_9SOLN|nr:hypothetical protein R3W88_024342 [Solanum pinnatisectum]